jgi:hypothetical protein
MRDNRMKRVNLQRRGQTFWPVTANTLAVYSAKNVVQGIHAAVRLAFRFTTTRRPQMCCGCAPVSTGRVWQPHSKALPLQARRAAAAAMRRLTAACGSSSSPCMTIRRGTAHSCRGVVWRPCGENTSDVKCFEKRKKEGEALETLMMSLRFSSRGDVLTCGHCQKKYILNRNTGSSGIHTPL